MSTDPPPLSQWPAEEQAFLLKSFADAAQEGFCIATFDSTIVYANPKLGAMLGLPVAEVIGTLMVDYLRLEDRQQVESVAKDRVRSGGTWSGELVMEGVDDIVLPVKAQFFLVRDREETPAFFAAVISDVPDYWITTEELINEREELEERVSQHTTELEQANEALRRQVQRLEQADAALQRERDFSMNVLNRSPAIIFGLDGDGGTTFLNPAGERLTGYTASEITGMHWWETFYPGELQEQVEQLFTAFTDGDVQNHRMTMVDRQGDEHVVIWNTINTYDGNGALRELVCVGYDMTDQVKAQNQLRVSEEKYRALYHESHDAYMTFSMATGFLDCNDATLKLFGCRDIDQFKTFTPADLSPEFQPDGSRSDEKALRMLKKAKEEGANYFEWRHRKVTGEEFDAMVLLNLLNFTDEPIFQATVRDVTEFLQLQERLQHVEKLDSIGKLAGGVAHDFNNMLGGISGATELLEMQVESHESLQLVRIIRDATERASELTRKLLAFSRKGKLRTAVFDVHTAITEALAILKRSIDRRIETKPDLRAQHSTVEGDSHQLQNAILNLGLNARDAMPDGGVITVGTKSVELDEKFCTASEFDVIPGSYVEIDVKDDGGGIDDAVLPHVFEPFFTTKEVGKGTGLGLSAVYGTVKDHHGMVTVSTEKDMGTVFKIYLPVKAGEVRATPTDKGAASPGKGTLLLVDDEEIIRLMGSAILESLGYSVILASDGAQAIELYGRRMDEIDAVILDMVMPKMNGSDAFRELKQLNPDVKVIFCSGFSREQCVDDLIDEGAVAFLQKPYKKAELGNVLRDCL